MYAETEGTMQAPSPAALPALRSYSLSFQSHGVYTWDWSVRPLGWGGCRGSVRGSWRAG